MQRLKIMSKVTLQGNEQCKVTYHQQTDVVVLEVGGTSLKLDACNFMMMNEMIRKAAAKLVMQTALN